MIYQLAEAAFAYWAKLSFWTIEQPAALLIGADPDVILDGPALASTSPTEVRVAYLKMFRLLDSHIRMSDIGTNQPPTEIIEWALHAKVDPPPALVDAVRAQGRTLIEQRTQMRTLQDQPAEVPTVERPLGERERATLLRMIIGMAIGGYGHDPYAKRSDVPKTIADDLADLGLECSDQTVREKLKDARELLANDWRERRGKR